MYHVGNVTTPSQFLIGDKDLRVPPHQSYYYEAALKARGIETRLYNYPGSGHALLPIEHTYDALHNISTWMDKFLIAPFEQAEEKAHEEEEEKKEA